jgi:Short C-terminal domain
MVFGANRRVARRTARRVSRRQSMFNQPEDPGYEAGPAYEAEPAPVDTAEEIRKLAELHEQGILTDEEFAAKKKQILGI